MSDIIDTIENTPHLLDILLEIEDLLDSLDMYVFKNWIEGELIIGPIIKRYWVDVSFKYPYEKMPDPEGAKRLVKRGIKVEYIKKEQEISTPCDRSFDYNPSSPSFNREEEIAKLKFEEVWIIKLTIPRKLVADINDGSTDYYEDDVDMDDVESAIDMGVDTETEYTS